MIYLENNNGTQQIFIPKNLNISINKTYDEGFQDGMNYQKEKLEVLNVTENGVYKSDNGYKQVNVEVGNENVCKLEELNIAIVNDIEEYTATDSNLDGFSKVNVDATEFGRQKYEEGYEQGKSEGGEGGSCNISSGSFEFQDFEDGHYWQYANEYGLDGWDYIDIDASNYGRQKYEEGYNQGKSEGGSCNISRLEEEINVSDEGHIVRYAVDYGVDGWSYLDLDVNQYGNRKYNQGYEQGKSECGECPEYKEGDLNIEWSPRWASNIWYAVNDGYDGYNCVIVNAEKALMEKYNQGYEQGKSECPECPELTDFSSEQVENKYSHLAFITRNCKDRITVVDKTKLVDSFDNYTPNGSINITQFKNGMCFAMDEKYLNPDFNGGCVIRKIEDGAIDWNAVDIFRSYTILEFGENMTRDKGSNLLQLYVYASTFRNETVIFNDGCFATSSRLNKIVFEEPFNVVVKGNPFEGISSWGQFIVKGEESNRSKYTDLINLLPTDWEVIFNPDYEE